MENNSAFVLINVHWKPRETKKKARKQKKKREDKKKRKGRQDEGRETKQEKAGGRKRIRVAEGWGWG